jgi:ubiquinone/menaquinone biosynthesis C-methylase UbiE
MSLEDRFGQLVQQLGIGHAHVGGGYAADAATLARAFPGVIASMTLVCPFRLPPEPFQPLGDRLLFIHGDRGPGATSVPGVRRSLPESRALLLSDYEDAAWSDAIAERRPEIASTLLPFLDEVSRRDGLDHRDLAEAEGEIAGITYRVRGSGPPLVLLPLTLARSQWEPLLPLLAEHYTTIVLGGAHLGIIPSLEQRMRGGYRGVVRSVVDAAAVQPGEQVVEIGCGSGAVARWLARHLALNITAVDVNGYLLREAAALTRAEGLAERITFQEGNAENLPVPDQSFDVTFSFTVMEEVNAARMLAELVRVTRPGGRVGVVVRATDMRPWINLPLEPALMRAVESVPGAGASEFGCSDASLYQRFREAGLQPILIGPQLAPERADQSPDRLRLFAGRVAQALEPGDSQTFRTAVREAVENGSMLWAEPYHCAAAIKP